MYHEKSKRDEHPTSRKSGISLGLVLLIVILAAIIWQNQSGGMMSPMHSGGGLFEGIFGLIGSIIGAVFGLIGHLIGFVFGLIGVVLGLVGGVIGLIFGVIGLVLGLVFGTLGLLLSVALPLAIIIIAVKLLGMGSSRHNTPSYDQKRKREWHDDDIVDV